MNNFASLYFNMLYMSLKKPILTLNMNHVADLTEFVIMKETDNAIKQLLVSNILFKFIHFLDYEKV